MQEDYSGTQAAGTGRTYSTCAECGAVLVRRAVRTEPAGLADGTHSEFTEICPDCDALDRQGERPVVPDPDDQ